MSQILNIFLTPLGVLGVVVVAFVGWLVAVYNKLVQKRLSTESSWSDIDTQLKKRFDLIPNLVETVKGYASHEKETLDAVIEARSKAGQVNLDIKNATPEQMEAFQASQGELSNVLGKLFALSEAYPDLKANQNFLDLQNQLKTIEDDLNMARRFYNGTVKEYNEVIQMFPSNIVAKIFSFSEKPFFKIEENERKNVEVKF